MLYEIETITETEAGETKTTFRLWMRKDRRGDVICYFDSAIKPVVDANMLVIREANKLQAYEVLYFSLHYGDIVEDRV